MKPLIQLVTPDQLQIREGGGCISAFGLPFFAAGVLLILAIAGVIPMNNSSELPWFGGPLIVLMGIAFTAVGGTLVFGRSWTSVDRAQRVVIKQRGLLIPVYKRVTPLDGYTAVRFGFIEGDSDTADRFPVSLKRGPVPTCLCALRPFLRRGGSVRGRSRNICSWSSKTPRPRTWFDCRPVISMRRCRNESGGKATCVTKPSGLLVRGAK